MVTLEQLRDWGADVDAAMLRCLNNEAFYLRLVGKAVREPSFEALREALEAGDLSNVYLDGATVTVEDGKILCEGRPIIFTVPKDLGNA